MMKGSLPRSASGQTLCFFEKLMVDSEQSNYQIPSNDKPLITTLHPVSLATVFQSISAGWQGDPKPTIAE
jgi:hypothetical protein